MSKAAPHLDNPPIVEAVLDLDCDLPPSLDLAVLETKARDAFQQQYPKFRTQLVEEHTLEQDPDKPTRHSTRRHLQALQFLHDDERQLVQVRTQGFSFNRLAPYSSFDNYLPEIERTWRQFCELTAPVQIRAVRLRYINRLLLPLSTAGWDLEEYFRVSPRLPDEAGLILRGFFHQHAAHSTATGHDANIVLTSQPPVDEKLPIIFDITVLAPRTLPIDSWDQVIGQVRSLRNLKNLIFANTLTEKCLNLFQVP